jgi:hypothetical protein
VYFPGKYQEAPKKVQDYVSGEETLYLPAYQAPGYYSSHPTDSQASLATSGYQPASGATAPAIEEAIGDQPSVEEQIQKHEYTPMPTVHQRKLSEPQTSTRQRRFSAPRAEWEPARYALALCKLWNILIL